MVQQKQKQKYAYILFITKCVKASMLIYILYFYLYNVTYIYF